VGSAVVEETRRVTDAEPGSDYVLTVERLVLVAFGVALLLAVVVVAAADQRWARRRRTQLSRALERSETRMAFNELMAAQSVFTTEVLRYEAALQAQRVPTGTVRIDLYAPGQAPPAQPLERMKDEPRRRLLAAKQRWEQLRPGPVADAGPPRWIGFGEVRSWGLFVFGGERAFLRLEHATDPSIWATVEVSRRRIGFGFGVGVQRIGAVADHADPSVLLAMVRTSLDHSEFAFRPGFDPVGVYRSVREGGPFQALAKSLRARSLTSAMWTGSTRDEVADARRFLDSLHSIDEAQKPGIIHLDTPDPEPGILRCSVAGPTVMLGWWRGRETPSLRLLGRSPHGEWSRRFDASGQHVPEPASPIDEPASSTALGVATNSHV